MSGSVQLDSICQPNQAADFKVRWMMPFSPARAGVGTLWAACMLPPGIGQPAFTDGQAFHIAKQPLGAEKAGYPEQRQHSQLDVHVYEAGRRAAREG